MHLMKRTLNSTHYKNAKESFKTIIEGYAEVLGQEKTKKVVAKIREIEKRGRYVADRD